MFWALEDFSMNQCVNKHANLRRARPGKVLGWCRDSIIRKLVFDLPGRFRKFPEEYGHKDCFGRETILFAFPSASHTQLLKRVFSLAAILPLHFRTNRDCLRLSSDLGGADHG